MFFRAKDKRSNQIGLHRTFQALRKAEGKRNERTGIARGRTGFNYMAVSPADRINYTLDHLVPLEIGGADVIENLWPEPRRSLAGEGDDTRKDQLERRLAALVCSGELDVSEAQKAIAEDWPGAYKQYFEPINIFPPAAGANAAMMMTTPPGRRAPPPTGESKWPRSQILCLSGRRLRMTTAKQRAQRLTVRRTSISSRAPLRGQLCQILLASL
jgi:hypothetical protein